MQCFFEIFFWFFLETSMRNIKDQFLVYTTIFILYFPYALTAQTWEQIPLRTMAQKNAGLFGGEGFQMIWDIQYAPSNPNILYLIVDTSQPWKSSDGGNNWEMKHKGFLSFGGRSLSIDPINEDIVFVVGSKMAAFSKETSEVDGIYRTLNGGKSWENVYNTSFFRLGYNTRGSKNFCFHPDSVDGNKHTTIFCGSHIEGILKSVDGGETWVPLEVQTEFGNIFDIKISPKSPYDIFVTSDSGFFRIRYESYVDKIENGLPEKGSKASLIAINPNNPDTMYVTTGNYGVYKSVDGGNNFTASNNGINPAHLGSKEFACLNMSDVNPNYLLVSLTKAGGKNFYYSYDGGEIWHLPDDLDEEGLAADISPPGKQANYFGTLSALHPFNKNIGIISSSNSHMEISTNGFKTWKYCGNGYTGGRATDFAFDINDANKLIFFLTDHGACSSENNGDTFEQLPVPSYHNLGTTSVGGIDPFNQNRIITAVGEWSTHILTVSIDGGQTWAQKFNTEGYYKFLAFHPQKKGIVYTNLFKSIDGGISWDSLQYPIYALYPGNGDIVYSIVGGGNETIILKSYDMGVTWTEPYKEISSKDINVLDIAVNPNNSDKIYVTTRYLGLLIWDGNKWIAKGESDGIEKAYGYYYLSDIALDPNHPEVLYMNQRVNWRGHTNGVFMSQDSGDTWEIITDNLGFPISGWELAVHPINGYIYFGSSHGTWRRKPPYITDVYQKNESDQLLPDLNLGNFPNPFNSTTIIYYSIPNSDNVSLKIFNIQGKLVRKLLEEHKTKGEYSIQWDGIDEVGNLATSGIYFYQIKTSSSAKTRKIILLR